MGEFFEIRKLSGEIIGIDWKSSLRKTKQRNASDTKKSGAFLVEIIERHKKELDPQQPKDFIDVCLLEAEKNGEVIISFMESFRQRPPTILCCDCVQVYNSDELMNCIWDFLNAGTETSSTTLKWALLYLTVHQVGLWEKELIQTIQLKLVSIF